MSKSLFLPSKRNNLACYHPISSLISHLLNFFFFLGYEFVESDEIDTSEKMFELLNIASNHPSRSLKDTFYLENLPSFLLRTHTSNIQTKVLQERPNQELKIITVGKVYRRDEDDATHTHQFTQLDGFLVTTKNVSLLFLKNTLVLLLKYLFGNQVIYRFRNSYFPFTVPSIEVDIQCIKCLSSFFSTCSLCKGSKWIEVLGAGLMHSEVLKKCGYRKNFAGMAFGLGIERLLMIKHKIEDIRNFFLNDKRFLQKF